MKNLARNLQNLAISQWMTRSDHGGEWDQQELHHHTFFYVIDSFFIIEERKDWIRKRKKDFDDFTKGRFSKRDVCVKEVLVWVCVTRIWGIRRICNVRERAVTCSWWQLLVVNFHAVYGVPFLGVLCILFTFILPSTYLFGFTWWTSWAKIPKFKEKQSWEKIIHI